VATAVVHARDAIAAKISKTQTNCGSLRLRCKCEQDKATLRSLSTS
jgi:hypothetical protein